MNVSHRPPPSKPDPAPPAKAELTARERIARAKVLARRALSYWKMAGVLFVAGCLIAVIVAMNVKRVYRSECVVLVKPAMKTDDRDETASEKAVKLAPKLKDTLLTRGRLEPIIKDYGLYGHTVDEKGMVDAIQEMKVHIGFRGRDSETFVISFEDNDAERTRAITQRLADTMMEDFRKNTLAATKQRADFLSNEENRAVDEVENANKALATFLAEHPEFATDAPTSFAPKAAGAAGANLPLPPAAGGDAQLGALLRQKTRIESEIRAAAASADSAHVAPNESITQLTKARDDAARKVAVAQTDLADKRTRYTDQHPDVIAAKAQTEAAASALHAAEQQLETAKEALPAPDTSQASPDLKRKLADVTGLIGARQAEIARRPAPSPSGSPPEVEPKPPPEPVNPLVELETEWARLLRATSDAKAQLDEIQRRGQRARLYVSAAEATGDTQMEIIDPAFKPTRPARGGRTNAALAGFGVAAVVAMAYAFGRVVTNDTIFDAADVEALNVIPVLGVVPRLPTPAPVGSAPQAVAAPDAPQHPGGARAT